MQTITKHILSKRHEQAGLWVDETDPDITIVRTSNNKIVSAYSPTGVKIDTMLKDCDDYLKRIDWQE